MATVEGPCPSPWSATTAAIQREAQPRRGFCGQILHLFALLVMFSNFQKCGARRAIALLLLRTLFFAIAEFKIAVRQSEIWLLALIALRLGIRAWLLLVGLMLRCAHRNIKPRPRIRFSNYVFGGRGEAVAHGINKRVRPDARFDSTKGFPGEGWTPFEVATWNTRSLTFERFNYCVSLGIDVLAITELWRKQQKFQTRHKQFIVSEARKFTKGPKKVNLCTQMTRQQAWEYFFRPAWKRKF